VQRNSYRIVSYKVKHNYDVKNFLSSYRYLLQKAIDVIWDNIEWKKKGKRLIPLIPKSKEFKRSLRNCLLKNWNYASHYVDSAIKTAYSILNSWKRNYLKGRRRVKPVVKRKFVRVKETLYVYRNDKIRVTVKPREVYLEFDLTKVWFKKRVEGCDLGELILKEDELIITFRKPHTPPNPSKKIAWDLNLLSMDSFCDRGWIKFDLKPLYTLHITYENKRRRIQRLSKTKPKTAKKLMEKYSKRYRNRVRDFLHKLTTEIAENFKDYEHGFEDLEKQGMFTKRKTHNRVISKQNWKQIIALMSYKANVRLLDPRNSIKTCPRCGGKMKHRKGQVLECRCGLVINRQLNASINLYLRMWGFPSSMRVWEEFILPILRRSGVTLKGDETDDLLPMNPEGAEVDVSQGGRMSIKDYVR